MRTKKLLLILITYCSLFIPGARNCFSQSQFQLVIGDSSNTEEARSIIQTTDGGYIAVGFTTIFNGDMYIVKLNSSGQLQWSRTVGGTGQDAAFSVVQTTDGGYAVAGFGQAGYGQTGAYFVKLTPGGSVEWTSVVTDEFADPAWSIVQTTDGGYAAAISYFPGGFSRMTIVKLDSMGMLQWSKRIVGSSYARCIRQTTDKGYVVAGYTGSFGAGSYDMFVVKIDSNGTLQWAKTVGGTNLDIAYSIVQTTDGGYAVAGETSSFGNSKMYIAKLDSSGMLQWTKVVGADFYRAYSIIQTTDGGYAVAGGDGGIPIVKLNPDGSLQWNRVVGGGYARSIIQTTDGGYAAAGYGGISGAIGLFIVKLDNNGNTCGNSTSPSISVETGGILGSPIPTVTNITLLDTTLTPATGSHGYVTPICVIGIQPVSNEIPISYNLYQNYPNPFNPMTKIKFDIRPPLNPLLTKEGKGELQYAGRQGVVVKVFDILGREIVTLVNETFQPGTYEVEWDGTNYASGVYYYKLSILNSGSSVKYQETKRMVLIK